MNDLPDIVARLRNYATCNDNDIDEAADEIERLRASRDRLAEECRAWRLWNFNTTQSPRDIEAVQDAANSVRTARAAVDAAGDLEVTT